MKVLIKTSTKMCVSVFCVYMHMHMHVHVHVRIWYYQQQLSMVCEILEL